MPGTRTRTSLLFLLLAALSPAHAHGQQQTATTQDATAEESAEHVPARVMPRFTTSVASGRRTLVVRLRFPNGGCSMRRFVPLYRWSGQTVELWFRNESTPEACDSGPDHVVTVHLPPSVARAGHLVITSHASAPTAVW
jgi:hypothetical protein